MGVSISGVYRPSGFSWPSSPAGAAAQSAPMTTLQPGQPAAQAPITTLPDPNNPLLSVLSTPVTTALVMADLGQALVHPIQTIKSLWNLGKDFRNFDALTPLSAASGPQARDALDAAAADFKATGLTHVLGFVAKAIDRKAAAAFTQLKPAVEQSLSATTGRQVTLVWPNAGQNQNWSDLNDTIAISETLAAYPPAVLQKAFNGVSQIAIQNGSLQGMIQPIQRQAATLTVSRPLLPGQSSVAGTLMHYLDQQGAVSTTF